MCFSQLIENFIGNRQMRGNIRSASMSLKVYLPIIMFLLILSFCQLPVTNAQSNIAALTVTMPGEQQRTISDKPVMVAGLWHYLNVTLIDSQPHIL